MFNSNSWAHKLTLRYMWSLGLIVAAGVLAWHFGLLGKLIPNPTWEILAPIAIIGGLAVWAFLTTVRKAASALDLERQANLAVAAVMADANLDDDSKVVKLLKGEIFQGKLGETAVAKMFQGIRASKESNPNYAIDLAMFGGLVDAMMKRRFATIESAANNQMTYALIGTFIGLVLGLMKAAGINNVDLMQAALLGFLSSIAVSLLSSLTGALGYFVLKLSYDGLEHEQTALMEDVAYGTLTRVLPIVNDPTRMAKIANDLKA